MGSESDSETGRREFQAGAFEQWLDGLAIGGAGSMLVSLVLKLERLGKTRLDVARRFSVMHRLMPVIRDLSDDLPKVRAASGGQTGTHTGAFCLEQRLWCTTYRSLKRTLRGLDADRSDGVRERNRARLWLLDAMFGALGRHLELSVLWGWPLPANTWQETHDLYAYFEGRLRGAADLDEAAPQIIEDRFDAQTVYKRLLLVGLLADQGASSLLVGVSTDTHAGALADWARESDLHDPGAYFGVTGTYLVEASMDAPPRRVPGALGLVSRAWVLELPVELLAALDAEKAKRTVSLVGAGAAYP